MAFHIEPLPGGYTRVLYQIEVAPTGFVNRAMARVFGEMMGTLKGYEAALLEVVKMAAEKRAAS
jgi:hypothetical protein